MKIDREIAAVRRRYSVRRRGKILYAGSPHRVHVDGHGDRTCNFPPVNQEFADCNLYTTVIASISPMGKRANNAQWDPNVTSQARVAVFNLT